MQKPKKKKGSTKAYFTKDTENAIVEYNNTNNDRTKNELYKNEIEYAFYKLAEFNINVNKTMYFDISKEDVKHEVMTFLLEKIHKYKQASGNGFSYFNRVAKNYLIYHNNRNYKKLKVDIQLSNSADVWELENDYHHEIQQGEYREFIQLFINYWESNIPIIFKRKRDIQIADCLIEIFRRYQYIEEYNKKAIYLQIREMTNYKTQYITRVVNKMKESYQPLKFEYEGTGYIDIYNTY